MRHEKARAQNYLDIAGVVLLALDLNGSVTMLNRKGCELLGYQQEELIGKNWVDTCLPERERPRILLAMQQLAAGNIQPYEHLENLVVTRSGQERLVAWHNTTIFDEKGNPVGTLSSGEDITERRAMEKARRASERRFRQVTETSPDAITLLDLDGRILMANPQAAHLIGFDNVEQLLAHVSNAFDLLAPEEHARAWDNIRRLTEVSILRDIEYVGVRRDGSRFPAEINTSLETDHDGKPRAMILVVRDISERKLAEQRRSQLLDRLAAVNQLQEELLLSAPLAEKSQKITETAVKLVDLDVCRIWILKPGDLCNHACLHAAGADPDNTCHQRGECLHLIATAGRSTHIDDDQRRIPLGCYKIGRIASGEQREFMTNSVTTDPQVADCSWAKNLGVTSFVGYRLHGTNGEALGVLGAFAKHPISEEDHAFLNSLAETTSKVIVDIQAEDAPARDTPTSSRGQQAEERISGQHEPRNPHAYDGYTWFQRPVDVRRSAGRRALHFPRGDSPQREIALGTDQRHTRFVAD